MNYSFYEKLEKILNRNLKSDTVPIISIQELCLSSEYGRAHKYKSYGCFIMSWMLCICYTECAKKCITNAYTINHWNEAFTAYRDLETKHTQCIFLEAMKLLRSIKTQLEHRYETYVKDIEDTSATYDPFRHASLQTGITQLSAQLKNDTWMHELLHELRFNIVQLYYASLNITLSSSKSIFSNSNSNSNGNSNQYQFKNSIQLTQSELYTLIKALPIFYPVTIKQYTLALSSSELIVIRNLANRDLNRSVLKLTNIPHKGAL